MSQPFGPLPRELFSWRLKGVSWCSIPYGKGMSVGGQVGKGIDHLICLS